MSLCCQEERIIHMDFSRRFDLAAVGLIFLVFLTTVYLTKDFLTTILLSIVLVFLLKPLYAVIYLLIGIFSHGSAGLYVLDLYL